MADQGRLKVVVLSGGGAHTTTYPGVWQAIHERIYAGDSVDEDYVPDHIIGTSGGALFGCLMAVKKNGRLISGASIKDKFKDQKPWRMVRIPAPGEGLNFLLDWGLIDIQKIIHELEKVLKGYSITWESLHRPAFQCVIADLTSGARRYATRDSGLPLATAVGASMAIPGVFTPVWAPLEKSEGKHCLVDGGVCEGLPLGAALQMAPGDAQQKMKILAVSPFREVLGEEEEAKECGEGKEEYEIKDLRDYLQALYRTLVDSKACDMVKLLEYSGVESVRVYTGSHAKNALDFSPETIEENYQLGRDAAHAHMEAIHGFFKKP